MRHMLVTFILLLALGCGSDTEKPPRESGSELRGSVVELGKLAGNGS